jgi:hypothetical protein
MSEPITDRLSRFTPDGTGFDRDALLFAAGRASARPNRRWVAVVGALAACQLLTLTLLWPRPDAPQQHTSDDPAPAVAGPSGPPREAHPSELWALTRRLKESGGEDLPPPTPLDAPTASSPPLRAVGLPPSLLN